MRTDLEQAGFRLATYPFNTVAALLEATRSMWASFAQDGRPQRLNSPTAQSVKDALKLIDMGRMWAIESRTTERPLTSASSITAATESNDD